ncbi:hypothetical protein ACI2JA_10860 [Alkalihalobacillus sp. NPDC078783]
MKKIYLFMNLFILTVLIFASNNQYKEMENETFISSETITFKVLDSDINEVLEIIESKSNIIIFHYRDDNPNTKNVFLNDLMLPRYNKVQYDSTRECNNYSIKGSLAADDSDLCIIGEFKNKISFDLMSNIWIMHTDLKRINIQETDWISINSPNKKLLEEVKGNLINKENILLLETNKPNQNNSFKYIIVFSLILMWFFIVFDLFNLSREKYLMQIYFEFGINLTKIIKTFLKDRILKYTLINLFIIGIGLISICVPIRTWGNQWFYEYLIISFLTILILIISYILVVINQTLKKGGRKY